MRRFNVDQSLLIVEQTSKEPGNIAKLPEGKVVLCDWQLVRSGPWLAQA